MVVVKTILYILLAVAILLLMIIIHEFGHYVAGKILKFKINEFSVGFGPKLFSKKKKDGEVFSLRLVPLGGFCAFEGETETSEDKSVRSFVDEKPWKRIIVLLSGGVFNLLSSVFFSFLFILIVGYGVPKIDTLYVNPETNAPYVSLLEGDEVRLVNGKKIDVLHSFEDRVAGAKLGDTVKFTVIRDGKTVDVDVLVQKIVDEKGEAYDGFGIVSERIYDNGHFGTAIAYCVPFAAKLSWSILGSFGQLFTGKLPITTLTGPVGTIGMMAQLSADNWRNVFILIPLIASNLGLFNLLPIPALDGSKVVFTTIEWIRKKPINRKVEGYIHTIGLFILFGFVIVLDIVSMIMRFL